MSGEVNNFQVEQEEPELENIASLAEDMVMWLPGCADVMIRKALQGAYRDFCRRTLCLQGVRRLTVKPGVERIVIAPLCGGVAHSITEVRLEGRRLQEGCDYMVLNSGRVKMIGLGMRYLPDDDVPEEMWPVLEVRLVELPKLHAEEAPRWFLERYAEAIECGALASLYAMGGRPWSDAGKAQMKLAAYENFCTEARCEYYGDDAGHIEVLPNNELL